MTPKFGFQTLVGLGAFLLSLPSLAQDAKPGWLRQAMEQRARDVEVAASTVASGRLLYDGDTTKKSWGQYCASSQVLTDRGEFRRAVREASKALFLGQTERNPVALVYSARDLAYAYSFAGDLDTASHWAERGLASEGKVWAQVDLGNQVYAPLYKIRGDIAMRRGRAAAAVEDYEKALDRTSRFGIDRPYFRAALASAELKRGNYDRAAEIFADLGSGGSEVVQAMARRGEADLKLAQGKPGEARKLLESAAAGAVDRKNAYDEMWFRLGLARSMLALGDKAAAALQLDAAVKLAEGLRGRFHTEEFKAGFFGDIQQVFEAAIELAMDAGQSQKAFELSEMSRARALADLIRGRAKVNMASGLDRAIGYPEIAAALPPGVALVSYHMLPGRTAVWIVRADGIRGQWLDASSDALAESVRAFRRTVVEMEPPLARAEALYRQLIAPLALGKDETAVFIPHKALHFLPFHALRGPAGWMIEERAIAYLPAASTLPALANRPSKPGAALVAFGNPLLLAGDLPSLPGAEVEVEKISALFSDKSTFLRQAATKERFVADSPASGYVHVAAHAQVDDIDPMYSRIRFAADAKGNGDLEAREFYAIDLSGTRLVALSACDSGLGKVANGDEFWGFKRTLLGAGVRTMVVSLWPVADDSTPRFMQRFYEGLRSASSSDALRLAQLDLLQKSEFSHPYFWAPFTLFGDWR